MFSRIFQFIQSYNSFQIHSNFQKQLFIAEENVEATEEDFHRALNLAHLVDDPNDAKQKIWCSAILRDDWNSYNVNAPLDTVQSFTIYKLIDLCLILCKNGVNR